MKFIRKYFAFVMIGACATTAGAADRDPSKNPFLAADFGAVSHFDSAQTDSMPYPIRRGTFRVNLRNMPHVEGGPVTGATMTAASPGYFWVSGPAGVVYADARNGGFKEVAKLALPGTRFYTLEEHAKVLDQHVRSVGDVESAVRGSYGITEGIKWIRGGIYGLVDKDNVLFSSYGGTDIYAIGLTDTAKPEAGLSILRSLKVKDVLGDNEALFGLILTYDGQLVLLGERTVAVIDRDFKMKPRLARLGADEAIRNSAAIDEKGGIYVASDKAMHKLVWTGTKLSNEEADGAWSSPYDGDPHIGTGLLRDGTGSTPTLMGFGNDPDKLVVITDGSDRMKLVAFWRNEIPAGFQQKPGTKSSRIAGQIQVTAGFKKAPRYIQSEQSVVVNGYGAFVVNNMGPEGTSKDPIVNAIALGPIIKPAQGMERFEWDPKKDAWKSVWTRNDVSSLTTVPSVSIPSNIVLVNGYSKKDGWEVTGMDWATGKTVHRTIFGQDNFGNGAYMINQLAPNGDLIFPSIAGPFRVNWEK